MSLAMEGTTETRLREAQFKFGRLIREINRKIVAGNDFKTILDFLFEALNTIIPYDRIGIALIEGEGKTRLLCTKWMKTRLPTTYMGIGFRGPLEGSSLQSILETGRPRIINDLVQYAHGKPESRYTRLALKDGIRSSLTCPIYSDSVPIGMVFFSSGVPNTYMTEHIETYLEIADEFSFIINQDRVRCEAAVVKSTSQSVRMLLHDLKSPVGVIQGFLQLAKDENWYETLGQDGKSIFAALERNADHMLELLNDLAELGQLNSQAGKVGIFEVSFRDFLQEMDRAGQDLASKKSISFVLENPEGLPDKAHFDPLKIRRVIDNLLSNAVKYSARGTNVRLSVCLHNEQLHFEVADQGQGIPENELCKLFQEFSKTSVRPTEGESSSGIGLAIVKKIVEQHSGQIGVRSEVGKGSSFSFWIPMKQH